MDNFVLDSKGNTMDQIKITIREGKGQFNVSKFNSRAKVVFETQVKPQIAKAKATEFPKTVLKCNNPV